MLKDQTTQQGAGHAWEKQLLKDKNYESSIMYWRRVSINDHTDAALFTHKNLVSPHSGLNLENIGSLVRIFF